MEITAQVASLADREQTLGLVLSSIYNQVDKIYVMLNLYKEIPAFCYREKITPILRNNEVGDAEKFYDIEKREGYILILDDVLIYPDNFVEYMLNGVERYNSPVTLYGKRYPRPAQSFTKWEKLYNCCEVVPGDDVIDVPGTGAVAFRSDMIDIKYSDFKLPNMADIWFGKVCHEQGVPIYCLSHEASYIKHIRPKTSIWREEKRKGFKDQTELLKTFLK